MKQGFLVLKSGEWEEYEKNTSRNEVKFSEWAFDRIKLSRRWQRMRQESEHRPRNHDRKHRLPATHHRASGEARRRYDVIHVPALQKFPDGRQRLMGLGEGERAR